MRMTARKTIVLVLGLLLAAGIPYPGATTVHADPGCGCHAGKGHAGECPHHGGCAHHGGCGADCPHHGECPGCPGCGCECGYPKGAGQAVPPCMQDNAATAPCGMHRMMHGGSPPPMMRAELGKHVEEMRATIGKLREIEKKMADQVRDGESFRRLSLEHAKLLTDLQASHLRHMEKMTAGGK